MRHDRTLGPITRWLFISAMALACLLVFHRSSRAEPWREVRSKHFRVFYVEGTGFAQSVLNWAEIYYAQIRFELGLDHVVQRDRTLWQWDQRCRIYLFPSRQGYLQATEAPRWSSGAANYHRRVVYSFIGAAKFLESVLPHELAHLLFREFVGFENPEVPRWLDEGVAQYAEADRREAALTVMQQGVIQGRYLSLDDLSRLAVNTAHGGVAQTFYAQAATLVHFLIHQYGAHRFIEFCSKLRDGYDLERALSFATSSSLQSLGDLEAAWRQFLLQQY
jgi:hypothetical protein